MVINEYDKPKMGFHYYIDLNGTDYLTIVWKHDHVFGGPKKISRYMLDNDMQRWLNQNLPDTNYLNDGYLAFKDKPSAVAFKMMWG